MNKNINWKSVSVVLMIISIILFVLLTIPNNENKLLKTLMIADNDYSENSITEQEAEQYYNLASLSYEEYDFKNSESYCKLARNFYSKSSQGYKNIKAELLDKNIKHELINIYISMLEESIKINNNMYEACEYFEVASRAYDNDDWVSGDSEIEMMNEKIIAHDNAVERYNNLLAEYGVKLKKVN